MSDSESHPPDLGLAKVYLVGAGPGDPEMLTLRGKTCLARADVVLYDYLVNPNILEHAKPNAERIVLGSHARGKLWSQEKINQEMIARARAGQTVVRLKGGDPAVFARGAEEAECLQKANIPFEIVPGITVALAAGSCAGIPITHRDLASAVAFVTGREQANQTKLDYRKLAAFPGTLVFYMGTTSVREWSEGLLAGGLAPDTPVAIIRRCSFPDQTRQACTLDTVAETVERPKKLRPPVIFVVGEVTRLASDLNWFEKRPLFGQTIWLTRPEAQARQTEPLLRELGADVQVVPAIAIEPPDSFDSLDKALHHLDAFDWIVFSSSNGVRAFCDRMDQLGYDARKIGAARLAAIGPGTADALRSYRLHADLIPAQFEAETLARELTRLDPTGRYLLIRASRGREVLHEILDASGAQVTQVVAYRSLDIGKDASDGERPESSANDLDRSNREREKSLESQLDECKVDWVTVTSSAIARSLYARFGDRLRNTKLAAISPITSATLRELGLEPTVEATTYTMDGLVAAMLAHKPGE